MSHFPNVRVVGMHFRDKEGIPASDWARMVQPGESVTLRREPDNEYDPYAIMVLAQNMHVGYVERGQAMWIAPELDEQPNEDFVEAEVTSTEPGRGTVVYPLISVTISESLDSDA